MARGAVSGILRNRWFSVSLGGNHLDVGHSHLVVGHNPRISFSTMTQWNSLRKFSSNEVGVIGLVGWKHTHRAQVVAFLQRSSVLDVSYLGLELPRGIVESRVKCCGLPQGIGPIYQGAAEWQVAYITSTNLLTLVNLLLVSPKVKTQSQILLSRGRMNLW